LKSFVVFAADNAGQKIRNLTLDRRDNAGPYSPDNCRWATKREQTLNRNYTRLIEFEGRSQCLSDWAREAGLSQFALWYRLEAGWPLDRAIKTPSKRQNAISRAA
jgi:hypothetical protein